MKNFIFILSFLSLSSLLFAQVPLTVSYNGNDVTDQTINLKIDETMYLPISNNGSSNMNVTIDVTAVTVPHKAPAMNVCWEACYPISGPQSVGTRTINAGENSGTNFDVFYSSDGNTNPANITFHIYEDGNSADYITLTLDTETVGVNDISQTGDITIYPNPANDYFSIKLPDNIKNPELKISNILGKTVLKTSINNSKTNVNIKDLPSGIYFVSVFSNGIIIDTKKLIVK